MRKHLSIGRLSFSRLSFGRLSLALISACIATPSLAQTSAKKPNDFSDQTMPQLAQRNAPATDSSSMDTSRMPYELRRAVQAFPVTLYTSANCVPCDEGRTLLRQRGVPFVEKTISTAEDLAALKALGTGSKLPQLAVGTKRQSGFLGSEWHAMLDYASYPKSATLPNSFSNPAPTAMAQSESTVEKPKDSNPAQTSNYVPPVAPKPAPDNPAGIRF